MEWTPTPVCGCSMSSRLMFGSWLQLSSFWGITQGMHAAKVFGSNAVQVLATLLLLSYTKIRRIVLETWSSTLVRHEMSHIPCG